ncbi:hypothetical protein SCHPADRAFT_900780 [Schizopora paradoxa]|uniref:Uncharacterized protein n=1 Tax=Schizopora paradoxa TaxID=27342 RepID=A0A0H2S009_9AGAM|nr:hypothetical protein SCHPADRAFT_900780 [Schizopora paradoxa]
MGAIFHGHSFLLHFLSPSLVRAYPNSTTALTISFTNLPSFVDVEGHLQDHLHLSIRTLRLLDQPSLILSPAIGYPIPPSERIFGEARRGWMRDTVAASQRHRGRKDGICSLQKFMEWRCGGSEG